MCLVMYLLVGAFYGTWRLYDDWERIFVPLSTVGLPRVAMIALLIGLAGMFALTWPYRIVARRIRRWRTRHVPKHICRLCRRMMVAHILAAGQKCRDDLDRVYGRDK